MVQGNVIGYVHGWTIKKEYKSGWFTRDVVENEMSHCLSILVPIPNLIELTQNTQSRFEES